ncbi:VanZ family protein [Paenibacillus xylanilyticus]|uniref:VanZ family protein n=1 Tax=Paenibacillus xylanilyticus TaxID=248903 RepID=A0A7Y6BX65_9BACL|nr:VanZ family protein [Paenibacillus xylanilyticus]NUU76560.1 VanZ family protein [Paenibacillus xylanilyticus]
MNKGKGIHAPWILLLVAVLAIAYMLIMGNLLFIQGRTSGERYQYNLIPLETIKPLLLERDRYNAETWVKNLFGNIVLFIPLGIWIPWLFRKCRTGLRFTLTVTLLLLAVELTQLVTRVGSFDVDDIILNTVGAWIGYAAFRLFIQTGTRSE